MYYLEHNLDKMDREQRILAKNVMKNPDNFQAKEQYYDWYINHTDVSLIDEINNVMNDFNIDINKKHMAIDIVAANMLYGVSPFEYFQFKFYEMTDVARNTYMTDIERFIVFRPFYDFSKYENIRNKWLQYITLGKFMKRDCARCEVLDSEADRNAFEKFVEKHKVFLFKPSRMSCGKGIRKINSEAPEYNGVNLYDSLVNLGGGGSR